MTALKEKPYLNTNLNIDFHTDLDLMLDINIDYDLSKDFDFLLEKNLIKTIDYPEILSSIEDQSIE